MSSAGVAGEQSASVEVLSTLWIKLHNANMNLFKNL